MSIKQLSDNANSLVGMAFIVGIGLVILSKFRTVSGIGTDANTALGNFITGIDDFADWVGIIVLVGVGAYLLSRFINKKD